MTVTDDQSFDAELPRSGGEQRNSEEKLSLLTYADLAKAATKMQAGATKAKAGWENLRALIARLQGRV